MIGIYTERFDTDAADAILALGGMYDALQAHPAIIKVHNSKAQCKWLKNHGFRGVIVYRNIGLLEEPFYGYTPSAAFADTYWAAIKPHIANMQYAVINVWPNEPSVDYDSLTGLDAFFARLAELAGADGFTIAGWALSAEAAAALADGRYKYILKSLAALKKYGHWLDLHGYFPWLTDPLAEPFLFPWRALRRLVAGLPNILAGEFGIDTNLALGRLADGYRTVTNNATYASQLRWADAELRRDNVPAAVYLATRANCPADQVQYNILLDDSKKNSPNPSVWDRIRGDLNDLFDPANTPGSTLPDTPPVGAVPSVVVNGSLNQRAQPTGNSDLLGVIEPGAYVLVEYPATNGYVKAVGQNYWLYTGSGRLRNK